MQVKTHMVKRILGWLSRLSWGFGLIFGVAVVVLLADGFRDELGKADVGLVLGNTVHQDGTPSRRLAARLDRTAELYGAGLFPIVITSGGRGREGWYEGTVMRDYLVERGVPAEKIIVDNQGLTTMASALNTRRILQERGLSSVLVVTQYFHIPRSKLALRRVGLPTVYSARARYFESRDLYSIPREVAGYVAYSFKKIPAAADN